jgi:hypothetical protein
MNPDTVMSNEALLARLSADYRDGMMGTHGAGQNCPRANDRRDDQHEASTSQQDGHSAHLNHLSLNQNSQAWSPTGTIQYDGALPAEISSGWV